MIAQMIIKQEKLKDNVMLYGYVDDNRHFLRIYDLIRIEEMWNAIEFMKDVARWAMFSRDNLFFGCIHAYHRYKYICRIIQKFHVGTLFLGDMWNPSCQLAAMSFHKKGLKICFYEEGNGHYIKPYGYGKSGNVINKIYALLIDAFYYFPLYGARKEYFSTWKGFVLTELPMDCRYSVVPFYHESFDKYIVVKPIIPDRLLDYITKEIKQIDLKSNTLLITSPLYDCVEERYEIDENAYVNTIVNYLVSMEKGASVHIKFHPREKEYIRKRILAELKEKEVDFILLGSEVNISVEFYLQFIHYEKVVMFLSSTSFYNGFLFPRVKFVSILEDYYNNCKAAGSQSIHLLEPLLNEISKE